MISADEPGRQIAMFDIEGPEHPKLLDVLDLGSGSGPHYIAPAPDESLLIVSDYFLNEDCFGKVHAKGDHKIHVARIERRYLVLDSRFEADFNTAFSTGPARPHGSKLLVFDRCCSIHLRLLSCAR